MIILKGLSSPLHVDNFTVFSADNLREWSVYAMCRHRLSTEYPQTIYRASADMQACGRVGNRAFLQGHKHVERRCAIAF